jgi:hypothetical protein
MCVCVCTLSTSFSVKHCGVLNMAEYKTVFSNVFLSVINKLHGKSFQCFKMYLILILLILFYFMFAVS